MENKRSRAWRRKQRVRMEQKRLFQIRHTWGITDKFLEENPTWHKRFIDNGCWKSHDMWWKQLDEKKSELDFEEGIEEYEDAA